jgi:transposase
VLSGKTGMGIIRAIVDGERDPAKLAMHRDRRCKRTVEEIEEALDGHFLEQHVYCLRLALQTYDFYQVQIMALEGKIEAELFKFDPKIDRKDGLIPESSRRERKIKGEPGFDVRRLVYPIFGTDLSQIEAVSNRTLLTTISEIGWDMHYWPTVKHFTSWLTLCPGNNKSGGVSHSGKTRQSTNRLAEAFRLSANALHKSQGPLGNYLRRMKTRIGKAEAITATAHKIARIVYTLLKTGAAYEPERVKNNSGEHKRRQLKRLHKIAAEQGFYLVSSADMERYNQLSTQYVG